LLSDWAAASCAEVFFLVQRARQAEKGFAHPAQRSAEAGQAGKHPAQRAALLAQRRDFIAQRRAFGFELRHARLQPGMVAPGSRPGSKQKLCEFRRKHGTPPR